MQLLKELQNKTNLEEFKEIIMEKNNNLMSGKGEKGEWKTINGAHVYIEDGQSVEEAMNKQFSKGGGSKDWNAPYKIKDKEGNEYTLVKNSQTKDGAQYRTPGGIKEMSKADIQKNETVSAKEPGSSNAPQNKSDTDKPMAKPVSTTQAMKQKLKEAGIDTKHISIREGGGAYSTSYNVKIKSPYIDADEVKKIVNEYESYEKDERTGEILEGGNTYVFATYDDSCFDEVSKPYISKAKGYIDEANAQQDGYGISIKEGVSLFKSGSCCEIFVRNKDSNRQHFRVYDENQLSTFLFQIDQFGKIVH